jgi:putative methionine-R-sulfoxide reductase with GAF domain
MNQCPSKDYSLIANNLTVYDQKQQFNTSALQEHEIKINWTGFYLQMRTGINDVVL